MSAPIFVDIGANTLNATQIKRVGVQGGGLSGNPEEVFVEFIRGGTVNLPPDITLGQVRTALTDALQAAAPF